jgi:hypothetical protein
MSDHERQWGAWEEAGAIRTDTRHMHGSWEAGTNGTGKTEAAWKVSPTKAHMGTHTGGETSQPSTTVPETQELLYKHW